MPGRDDNFSPRSTRSKHPTQNAARVKELLAYLEVADLEHACLEEVLGVVVGALEECPEQDERYAWLVAAEAELVEGRLPLARLRRFAARFPLLHRPEAVEIEQEFRQIARSLPDEVWQTPQYLELAEAFDCWDDESLCVYLDNRYQAIRTAWDEYRVTPVVPAEVTAETYVGHRLLGEGLQAWLGALERDPGAEALAEAEWGTRLLIAVQMLHRRVARSLEKPNPKAGEELTTE